MVRELTVRIAALTSSRSITATSADWSTGAVPAARFFLLAAPASFTDVSFLSVLVSFALLSLSLVSPRVISTTPQRSFCTGTSTRIITLQFSCHICHKINVLNGHKFKNKFLTRTAWYNQISVHTWFQIQTLLDSPARRKSRSEWQTTCQVGYQN